MINIAVEGESDRETGKAVVRAAGHEVGIVRSAGGKTRLDPLIAKYNQAAARTPWVVFRDSDGQCPVELRRKLLAFIQYPRSGFAIRIAHTMSESWLMADRENFADYFSVPLTRVPSDPENLQHGKQALLALCASSRSRAIRLDVVASDGRTGPLYVNRINEFASSVWDANSAANASESLHRAIREISSLA